MHVKKQLNLDIMKIYLICIVFTLYACSQKTDNEIFNYSLNDNVSFQKEIGLKEFARDIEYTKLEYKPECVIGDVNNLEVTKGYIFVSTIDNDEFSLYQFNEKGEFVRKIGKHGRGPREYPDITDIEVNENRIFVLSTTSKQILVYNFDGTFYKSIRIEKRVYDSFKYLGNGMFALQSGLYIDDVVLTEIIDQQGNSINKLKSRVFNTPEENFDGKLYNVVYQYGGEYFIKESKNDTVYKITGNALVPHFVYNLGKYKQPTICSEREWYKYYVIYRIIETDDYIFTFFTHDNTGCIAKYDKNNGKVVISIPEDKLKYGIKNDFDNGHDFSINLWTSHIANQFEWLLPLSADKLTDFVDSDNLSGNFKTLMDQFDPNDNPVIMKIKLKEK